MERLSESEIRKILKEHKLWLETDGKEGERARFMSKDLSGMDFHDRDLRKASFSFSDLKNANFQNTNLRGSIFCKTDLRNADFRGADLTNAIFYSTDMDGVIYDETTLPAMVCPEEGSFIGYKKAFSVVSEDEFIVKLRIPVDAKRSSGTGNKCRCSKAEVLSITNLDGTETDETYVCSNYDPCFVYLLGETIEVPDFDKCRWKECASGIHFFMNRENAVNYEF